ncbi:MAG TPA: hypothetical protein VF017_10850 [Thermoanaerobaculia bacterium]|nr:hypothetical protein [Thermoanaerobaculia bacterium]
MTIAEKLTYLSGVRGQDQATLAAQALDAGVQALYREALIEGYLAGELSRQDVVHELGEAVVARVDVQRQAIDRDFEWGLAGG